VLTCVWRRKYFTLPDFQERSRARKQSPGLDFLPTFSSMEKVGRKKYSCEFYNLINDY
jgi:hypothetical protein